VELISKEVAYDLLKAVHREDFKTGKACAMFQGIGNGLERIAALRILHEEKRRMKSECSASVLSCLDGIDFKKGSV